MMRWVICFLTAILFGCQNSADNSFLPVKREFGVLKLKLDTVEIFDERFFSVEYELISLRTGNFKIGIDLSQDLIEKHQGVKRHKDSMIEYLYAGDTLFGSKYYSEFPISKGVLEISHSLQYYSDDNEEKVLLEDNFNKKD
tara:strand:+ start:832 stop:1254 length:423 start_codon:yes stop_codon:yes gene_type:complete